MACAHLCAFFLICRFLGLFKSRLTSLKRAIHSNLQLQLIWSCQKISSLVHICYCRKLNSILSLSSSLSLFLFAKHFSNGDSEDIAVDDNDAFGDDDPQQDEFSLLTPSFKCAQIYFVQLDSCAVGTCHWPESCCEIEQLSSWRMPCHALQRRAHHTADARRPRSSPAEALPRLHCPPF